MSWWRLAALLLACFIVWRIRRRASAEVLSPLWRGNGKVAIVTGANSGIGRAVALDLARREFRVICACRSRQRAEKAIAEMKVQSGNDKIEFRELDLTDLSSVHVFVQGVARDGFSVDLLVANAGVMYLGKSFIGDSPVLTAEGHSVQFFANYVGHWLLINLMIEHLAEKARIIAVSSSLHYFGEIDFDDLHGHGASLIGQYARSKLAQILHARELQRRLNDIGAKITINAVHPGYIASEVVNYLPKVIQWLFKLIWDRIFLWHTSSGAKGPLLVALDPQIDGLGGLYFDQCERAQGSSISSDPKIAVKLWSATEKLTNETFAVPRLAQGNARNTRFRKAASDPSFRY